MNGLTYDQDVKLLSVGDIQNFYDYTARNENKTRYGVIWCTSEWKVNDKLTVPCNYEYQDDKNP